MLEEDDCGDPKCRDYSCIINAINDQENQCDEEEDGEHSQMMDEGDDCDDPNCQEYSCIINAINDMDSEGQAEEDEEGEPECVRGMDEEDSDDDIRIIRVLPIRN